MQGPWGCSVRGWDAVAGQEGAPCLQPCRDAHLLSRWRVGAVARFFPELETTSPLSAKGGGGCVSLPALHQPPPKSGGSARGVGTGGLHGHSTSSSFPSPAFALQPSPAEQGVPISGRARRAEGTLKKGLLTQSSFRFADQRPPPPPGAAPLGSRSPEEQPFARLAMSQCLADSVLEVSPLFLGGGRGLNPPSARGREWGEAMPPVTSPLPRSQASPPPPAVRLYYIFTTNPVPMVASSCKHFRPVTFILKTNKHQ